MFQISAASKKSRNFAFRVAIRHALTTRTNSLLTKKDQPLKAKDFRRCFSKP